MKSSFQRAVAEQSTQKGGGGGEQNFQIIKSIRIPRPKNKLII